MFKKMSQGFKGKAGPFQSQKQKKHNKNLSGSSAMSVGVNQDHVGAIKRNAEEEMFASGMPVDHPSLSSKIDSHRAGNLFKYAVITNKPSDERSEFMSKLRIHKPQVKSRVITLSDINAIRLIGDSVEFDLSQSIDRKSMGEMFNYLLIDCVLIHYIPLDSFANDKSVVTIQMNDFRKTNNTVARRCKVDSTMGYNILFMLDFCVETKDMSKMTLSFASHSKEFQEGVAWGAVKVVVQFQTLSFPKRTPLIDTMGVMLFADSDLSDFESDPRDLDLVITPESLKRLRGLHKRGEIENKTIHLDDTKPIEMARTGIDMFDDTAPIESQIGLLKSRGQELNREKISMRSILKQGFQNLNGQQDDNESETKRSTGNMLDELDEPDQDDSVSQTGDTATEVAEQLRSVPGGQKVRVMG